MQGETADMETTPPTPPRKYMRYKSVQQAGTAMAAHTSPPAKKDDATISRSMSRYRRPRNRDPVVSPPLPSGQILVAQNQFDPTKSGGRLRRVTDPVSAAPDASKHQMPTRHDTVAGTRPPQRSRETNEQRAQRKARELRDQEEAHIQLQNRTEDPRKVEPEAEQARRVEAEASRLLEEQKKKDLERLEATLEAATTSNVTSPKEKFGFFRRRAATKTSTPQNTGAPLRSQQNAGPPTRDQEPQLGGGLTSRLRSNTSPHSEKKESQLRGIEQGGGGVVPGIDAPISASNAGERRVLVRCKQSSINLPITPETTPKDIIYSAANIMSQDISPLSAVLVEAYTTLGLERPIRRYEHIRDIMNSWDRDTQNALILQNYDAYIFESTLEDPVPKSVPKDITAFMYHSQKPGKWNKRYITLLSSGQIFMSKKKEAKITDKDSQSLCHLSDFDIYSPTPQQLRKNLRPPKKHCYAIKSQQRTTMFESTTNFVHFFCTEMEEIADIWYKAVQRWRSWYLVTKLGEGSTAPRVKAVEVVRKPTNKAGPSHRVTVSVDEDPYTIGSFKPLVNIERFDKSSADAQPGEEAGAPQVPFFLRHGIPTQSRDERSRYPPAVTYQVPQEPEEEEFAAGGLLGRTYSQRQTAAKEREAKERSRFQPPAELPSFAAGGIRRSISVKSTSTGQRPATAARQGGLQRNVTVKEKPKPLLDFTPQFKEPPQWDKSKYGHGVAAPLGVPLVEAATTPDNPLAEVASPAVFRRDTTKERRPMTSAPHDKHGPFVQGGLVSRV